MTEAQAQQMLVLLAEIRDELQLLGGAGVNPDDALVAGCQHPEELRVDLSTPADVNHWVCRDCRFDNKAVA